MDMKFVESNEGKIRRDRTTNEIMKKLWNSEFHRIRKKGITLISVIFSGI
jgi:hypothetical protein